MMISSNTIGFDMIDLQGNPNAAAARATCA
jgi:hypothetical protein